jgi:hypothetical protein
LVAPLTLIYSSIQTFDVLVLTVRSNFINFVFQTFLLFIPEILLMGEPEGRRPLGRPRRRWVDNIRIDLERWDGVMWTGLVWLRKRTGGVLL